VAAGAASRPRAGGRRRVGAGWGRSSDGCRRAANTRQRPRGAPTARPPALLRAGGRDLDIVSPTRQRVARILGVALPTALVGVLAWGFWAPDEEPLFQAQSPHQVGVAGETLVNWSATHDVKPR